MGQELDKWLEDDDNLKVWENNELTTRDRRILLATWYVPGMLPPTAVLCRLLQHGSTLSTQVGC